MTFQEQYEQAEALLEKKPHAISITTQYDALWAHALTALRQKWPNSLISVTYTRKPGSEAIREI